MNIEQLQTRRVHEINFTPYSGRGGEEEERLRMFETPFLRKILLSKGKK